MARQLSYYEILGVEEDSSQDELKKAFRKLTLRYHPDRPGGNEEKFKEVMQAYKILSDPMTRQQYDSGNDVLKNRFGDDIFEFLHAFNHFTGGISKSHIFNSTLHICKERSKDTEEILEVDLLEVCNGTLRQVEINKKINCPLCEGRNINTICTKCEGNGIVEIKKKLVIDIKPGVVEGQEVIRIDEGDEERNKCAGDRVFKIKYMTSNNNKFQYRPFKDIVYRATIQLSEAVWRIETPMRNLIVDSNLILTKNTGGKIVKDGDEMFVENEGIPDYFHPKRRGRLIIEFNIEWPEKLTEEQQLEIKKLFQKNTETCVNRKTEEINGLFLMKPDEQDMMLVKYSLFPEKFLHRPKIKNKWSKIKTRLLKYWEGFKDDDFSEKESNETVSQYGSWVNIDRNGDEVTAETIHLGRLKPNCTKESLMQDETGFGKKEACDAEICQTSAVNDNGTSSNSATNDHLSSDASISSSSDKPSPITDKS